MVHALSRPRLCSLAVLWALLAGACGPALTDAEARDRRKRLRDAMDDVIVTREARDAQSRLLAEVVENGALEDLNEPQIRAAIGKGRACREPLCEEHGFGPNDYYYEIGIAEGDEVKQLPVLIVGFDQQGRAARIWTLSTH